MKTVILCGGMGTRLSEETGIKPKPMVTIGGHPILWHIMNLYSHQGYEDFILALGYKGDQIKQYFLQYYALNSDFSVDLSNGKVEYLAQSPKKWKVTLVDTGEKSQTGGRLLRLRSHLESSGTFMLTYGDGVCDVPLKKVLEFHKAHGKLVTVTAVPPISRFGSLSLDGDRISHFEEKPQGGDHWINGGFIFMEPGVFRYLENDETILERKPLEKLAADGQLMAYRHNGFWQCMDTLRDREYLETLWRTQRAAWKIW